MASGSTTAKVYRACQSCGMPMNRDEQGGGTEADGSKSAKFCSHCYVGGRYVLPDLTVEEMRQRVRAKLVEMRIPGFLASFFTRSLPRLERWQRPHSEADHS